jgi:predicted lactoylglutathione lyase
VIEIKSSMIKQTYLNVPVSNLPKSLAFFQALGFSPNPQFTGDAGACIIINETTFVMLLPHARFRDFTSKEICDASKAVEVLFCFSCESQQEVDDLVAKAVAAGGTADKAEDYGFMYTHGFSDLDGHQWGLAYVRPSSTTS